jgi:CDP-diacylglycerol---glycerol-3-phosphate 3-phosphatidyltransferase
MNLPNWITVARIAAAPLIGWLPFLPSSGYRLAAFVLFIAAAVTDYYDGMLARTRHLETDLGRLLDPFADKLLLVATFVPMYVLMAPAGDPFVTRTADAPFAFVTPWGLTHLAWWIVAIVLGREVFMTVFRQVAARRGVVIGAIFSAKLKTVFHFIWIGASYFWFFIATLASERHPTSALWHDFALFNGFVGVVAMWTSVMLAIYSLAVYLRRFGGSAQRAARGGSPAAPS